MSILEDEYTYLDELGQGAYATVYKVRHNKLGYIRAIRVLKANIACGETDPTYQKFLKECRLLLRLGNGNHPNIVHIYQPLLKAQQAIVEMDFVDGKDLYHYLEEKHSFVEIKDVLRLLSDIGSALSYCHEDIYKFCMDKDEDNLQDDPEDGRKVLLDNKTKQELINKYRVIHNDIHSGNIIRREDGSYVLLDFGLAIDKDKASRVSQIQGGVPEFKSPEKWDNVEILTPQSDIYSFGVVLYEYLAGRVPFKLENQSFSALTALMNSHKNDNPPLIFEFRKAAFERVHPDQQYVRDYPDWLEELILKCLAKSPNDRFKDGKELYDFVLRHIGEESTISKLKQEVSALQGKLEVANQEVSTLSTKAKRVQTENARLKKQLKSYEGPSINNTPSSETISASKDDLTKAQSALQDALNKLSVATTSNRKLRAENKELSTKLASSSARTTNARWLLFLILLVFGGALLILSVELIDYKSRKASVTEANFTNASTIVDLERKVSEKDSEIQKLTKEINELRSNNKLVVEPEIQGAEMQNAIDDKNKTIKQLNSEISKLRKHITNKDKTIKEKDRLIEALNEQIGV